MEVAAPPRPTAASAAYPAHPACSAAATARPSPAPWAASWRAAPAGPDIPATVFSASRAMRTVQATPRQPCPAGMNFASVDRAQQHHRPRDVAEQPDPRARLRQGGAMPEPARYFGQAGLAAPVLALR